MSYLNAALNVLFSPLTFLLFFITTTPFSRFIYKPTESTNVTRLVPWTYLVFCVILFLLEIALVSIYNITAPKVVNFTDIFQPKYYWVSIISWLATAFTLRTYTKGMEGNVMGFIFFPMLLVSSIALLMVNTPALVREFNMGGQPVTLNAWLAFFAHSCNPLLVLLFSLNSTSTNSKSPKPLSTGEKVIAIYIVYGFLVAVHWLLFLLSKNSFSMTSFFGAGQSFVYFLPFLGGLLIHIYFGLSLEEKLSEGLLKYIVSASLKIIIVLSLLLQFINYIQYILRAW